MAHIKFIKKVNKNYAVLAGGIKDLTIKVEEYLRKHKDDHDYLYDMSHNKDIFLKTAAVKTIAKRIHDALDVKWLYDIIKKSK